MKIPFMLFIEPLELGGSLYFVYGYNKGEDNCECIGIYRSKSEDEETAFSDILFSGCDLSRIYLENKCKNLEELETNIDYLKKIFRAKGYDSDLIGDQVSSIDDLLDIDVVEFENMTKIKESIKIKDDGTPDYEAMTEEERDKFFKDLYQLFKADAAVFDGAADDGEDLNDLKIDRWNESLKLSDIDVDKTLDDNKRDFLNNRKFESIKKIHTWEPGVVRESKFDRYTEEVNPVDDHSDTDKFIKKLHLGESREATDKSDFETPEMRLMKRPKKLQESTPNFMDNDGDFPLVVKYLDEALSMPCPECGFNIYDDPDDEGNRTCDECGYVASEAEWRKSCVIDSGLEGIIEDEVNDDFESALRKFGVDDLKYWFVSIKPGHYEGVQAYVEDSNYSLYDDISYENNVLDALNEIAPDKVSEVYSVLGDDADETDYDNYYSFENLCEDIDNQKAEEEAKKINDFLDYLVKDLGWTKIEKVATFSNGEAIYKKVEKRAEKSNRIKEARLQEGPGAGYDVEFLGIKITNVKIDEIKLDDYNCQYVEFEADIVPGEYDWNAEGYDWRVDGDSDYLDNYEFYQKAKISGGKVTGTCENGYQGWADANATWTIDEFVKEIEGESYDLGIMYGAGWSHSDITSPFEMEDDYGIDKSDERSGYKNSYISTASIELEDPEMLNQIIEDTRYSDYRDDEYEDYDLNDAAEDYAEDFEDAKLATDDRQAGQWYESKSKDSSLKESNDAALDRLCDMLSSAVEEWEIPSNRVHYFIRNFGKEALAACKLGNKKALEEVALKYSYLADACAPIYDAIMDYLNSNKNSNKSFDTSLKELCDMLSDAVEDWETPSNRVHYFIRNFGKEALAACKLGNKKALEEVALKYSYLADACPPIYDAIMDYLYKQPLDESEDSKKLSNTKIEEAAEGPALGKVDVDSLIKEVEEAETTDDKLDVLFDALVPRSGKADTLAGELVRAIVRIIYRDFNDGDIFYEGYGKETCASSAAFICEKIPELKDTFIEIIKEDPSASSYTYAIESIGSDIVDYLLENRDTFEIPNDEDSRSDYGEDYFDEWAPYDDYYDDYEDDDYEDYEEEEEEDSHPFDESLKGNLQESYGPSPIIWDEDLYDYVKECALDAVEDYISDNDIALYDNEIDGVSEYVANLFWENEDREEGEEAVMDALKNPYLFDANIPFAIKQVVGDYILDNPINTRDYLLRKEECCSLDKEEMFILQDLIQRYGKPDSLYESNEG